jgi:hypothetical protein
MEKTLKDFIDFLKPYNFDWDSEDHIKYLISCFLDKYQPERLSPEDILFNHKKPLGDLGELWNISDSPNSTNK